MQKFRSALLRIQNYHSFSPCSRSENSTACFTYCHEFGLSAFCLLPCGSTRTSSGDCQEMETCMVWACHMPRQPLQNRPSGCKGNAGWTTSKSGRPCPWRICSQGPPAEQTGRGSLLNRPSCPLDDPVS